MWGVREQQNAKTEEPELLSLFELVPNLCHPTDLDEKVPVQCHSPVAPSSEAVKSRQVSRVGSNAISGNQERISKEQAQASDHNASRGEQKRQKGIGAVSALITVAP